MYRFSLSAFLRLFQRSLEAKQVICQHLWVCCLSRIRAGYWQVLAEVKVLEEFFFQRVLCPGTNWWVITKTGIKKPRVARKHSAKYCGLRPLFPSCLTYTMFSCISFSFLFLFFFFFHVYQRLSFFPCSFCDFILFYCWINRTKKANKTALFTIITHLLSLLKLYLLFDSCSLSLLVMFLLLSLWKYVTFL